MVAPATAPASPRAARYAPGPRAAGRDLRRGRHLYRRVSPEPQLKAAREREKLVRAGKAAAARAWAWAWARWSSQPASMREPADVDYAPGNSADETCRAASITSGAMRSMGSRGLPTSEMLATGSRLLRTAAATQAIPSKLSPDS